MSREDFLTKRLAERSEELFRAQEEIERLRAKLEAAEDAARRYEELYHQAKKQNPSK